MRADSSSLTAQEDHTASRENAPVRRAGGWRVVERLGLGCLTFLAFLVVVVVLLLALGFTSLSNLLGGFQSMVGLGGGPTTASVVSTQRIITGVQPLGQLVSINMQFAEADIHVGVQQGVLNACGYAAQHVVTGSVEAGVDLTQITEGDIVYNPLTDTYTLTLPPPQLTGCTIERDRQYDRQEAICGEDWEGVRQIARYQALLDFRQDALEGGILDRAQQEATLVLGNFVQALTGGNVEIVFREGDSPLPSSCQPAPPDGWTYDEALRAWVTP